jgi:hypothetical protein
VSQFADFALLASIPGSGGVEILRAQRVLPGGAGPLVHLALVGRGEPAARRVVSAATAGSALQNTALARILEVAIFEGVVFGVGDPADGVDLGAVFAHDKPRRRALTVELAVGVTLSVARIAIALHAQGQARSADGASGLTALFPGGLSPDALFLDPQTHNVRVRMLTAAAGDPAAPSTFRAPEGRPSMAGDVFALGRLLMALLAGDPQGLEVPRLSSSSVMRLLPRLVDHRPEERPPLPDVVARLEATMAELQSTPERAVQAALGGPLRSLVVDAMPGIDAPPRIVDDIRMRLPWIYGTVQRLFPTVAGPGVAASRAGGRRGGASGALPTPQGVLPARSDEGGAVFTDTRPAANKKPSGRTTPTMMIPDAKALMRQLPGATTVPADDADVEGDAALRPRRTVMIDPSQFVPFQPPVPGAPWSPIAFQPPPPPPSHRLLSAPPTAAAHAPPPPPVLVDGGAARQAPPPPSLFAPAEPRTRSPAVRANATEARVVSPDAATAFAATRDGHDRLASALRGELDEDEGSDAEDGDDHERTMLARFPRSSRPSSSSSSGLPPLLGGPTTARRAHTSVTDSRGSSAASSLSADGELENLDGEAFEMVGEGGQTFDETNNPFRRPTRMVPEQAEQRLRQASGTLRHDADVADDFDPYGGGATEMLSVDRVAAFLHAGPVAKAPVTKAPVAKAPVERAPLPPPATKAGAPSPTRAPPGVLLDDDLETGGATEVVTPERLAAMLPAAPGLRPGPGAASTPWAPADSGAPPKGAPPASPIIDDIDPDNLDGATEVVTPERLAAVLNARSPGRPRRDREGAAMNQPSVQAPTKSSSAPSAVPARPVHAVAAAPSASSTHPRPAAADRKDTAATTPAERAAGKKAPAPPVSADAPPTTPVAASERSTGKKTPALPASNDAPPTAPVTTKTASAKATKGVTTLTIEAPDGARVLVNGTEVGLGRVVVDVASSTRAIVKVLAGGCTPWSSVVDMGGRAKLRVKPQLKPKA